MNTQFKAISTCKKLHIDIVKNIKYNLLKYMPEYFFLRRP